VADCAAGMRAAADRGWCDPHRMVPYGGSAGGFTVLLLLARHPELCAAGIDLYGVADLFELDETTHRFEKHYLHSIVGPLPEAAVRYRERSPVNLAERIKGPLLILQGEDDAYGTLAQVRAAETEAYCPVDVTMLARCGHSPHLDQPAATLDAVDEFVHRLLAVHEGLLPAA